MPGVYPLRPGNSPFKLPCLSNEEVLARLDKLRQSILGFCPSMLSDEEMTEFHNKQGEKEEDFCSDDCLQSLRVKKNTRLVVDTQIFVYLVQRNVAAQHNVVEAAEKLLQLHFEFVIGAITYTKIAYVIMRDNTHISGLMAESKEQSFNVLEAQMMVAMKL
ncbi:hypothetical protein L7F22_030507 [Adiantum nelumboides]|nr:hypothetical protein [Adiantum nelumboides]